MPQRPLERHPFSIALDRRASLLLGAGQLLATVALRQSTVHLENGISECYRIRPTDVEVARNRTIPHTIGLKQDRLHHSAHLLAGADRPLHAIADLLARLAEHARNAARRERVRVDGNVVAIALRVRRAAGLIDDAQVERIDAVRAEAGAQLVHVHLVHAGRARQQRGALPVRHRQLLAREDAGELRVVGEEHGERGIAGNAERKVDAHLGRHVAIGHGQLAGVAVHVLDGRQADGEVLRRLLDGEGARLRAARYVVHQAAGRGGGLLDGIPDAEELDGRRRRLKYGLSNLVDTR